MKAFHISLLAAMPLCWASCTTGLDLVGERYVETDEFYLAGGESHIGDEAIDEARYGQWMDEYDEYSDGEFDDPYAGQMIGASRSQLWNRYTPGWAGGFNSGFGNPYCYGNPYGSASMGSNGGLYNFGTTTYGHGNMAFMNGFDAWGNPIGGFGNAGWGYGNPYGMGGIGGNGWGYDPWGGGYWGTPQPGYFGGHYGYGYNPYFGNLGAYGNPWAGNGAYNNASGGIIVSTPPRPRPSLGQFTGIYGGPTAGNGGQAGDGSADNNGSAPAVSRTTERANADNKRSENQRIRAERQRIQKERESAQRDALQRQREARDAQRITQERERQQRQEVREIRRESNRESRNSWTPSRSGSDGSAPRYTAPREERSSPNRDTNISPPRPSQNNSTRERPSQNSRPTSPRPSNSRGGSSRGGRGG